MSFKNDILLKKKNNFYFKNMEKSLKNIFSGVILLSNGGKAVYSTKSISRTPQIFKKSQANWIIFKNWASEVLD